MRHGHGGGGGLRQRFSRISPKTKLFMMGSLLLVFFLFYYQFWNNSLQSSNKVEIVDKEIDEYDPKFDDTHGNNNKGNKKSPHKGNDDKEGKVEVIEPAYVPVNKEVPTEFEIEEGFVTMWDSSNYKALGQVLIDSILHFSTRSIVVMMPNNNPENQLDESYKNNPRIKIKSVDCPSHAFFCKMNAILKSGIKYGVWADTDAVVVSPRIDDLFEMARKNKKNHPLMPRHPGPAPNNLQTCKDNVGFSGEETMPYVHAAIILFSPPGLDMIYDVWMAKDKCDSGNYDETALNVFMWKYKVTEFVCFFEPYFTFFEQYVRQTADQTFECTENTPCLFRFSHGQKSPHGNRNLFDRAKGLPSNSLDILRADKMHDSYEFSCCPKGSYETSLNYGICSMKEGV